MLLGKVTELTREWTADFGQEGFCRKMANIVQNFQMSNMAIIGNNCGCTFSRGTATMQPPLYLKEL